MVASVLSFMSSADRSIVRRFIYGSPSVIISATLLQRGYLDMVKRGDIVIDDSRFMAALLHIITVAPTSCPCACPFVSPGLG